MSSVQRSKQVQLHSQCLSFFNQTLETLGLKVKTCVSTVYTIQFLAAVMQLAPSSREPGFGLNWVLGGLVIERLVLK